MRAKSSKQRCPALCIFRAPLDLGPGTMYPLNPLLVGPFHTNRVSVFIHQKKRKSSLVNFVKF